MPNEVKQANKVNELRRYLESKNVTRAIEEVLPKFLTVDKLLSVVLAEVRKAPKLLECDQESFTSCLIQCVQVGLVPGALFGQAYLIPRSLKGKMTCTLMPGYRGYVVLAERAGTSLTAQCYCENDIKYECILGSVQQIIHIPANDNRGKIICAYAIAKSETIEKDGTRKIITKIDHMAMSDIKKARACSQCPEKFWDPWEHEMTRKTPVRRLGKYLDLSPEFNQLREIDNSADSGTTFENDFNEEPDKPPVAPIPQNKKLLNKVKQEDDLLQENRKIFD